MLKPLLLLLEGIWNRAQIVCLEKSTIMAQDTLIIYFITLVNGRLLFYLCVARLCVCVFTCVSAHIECYMCLMNACGGAHELMHTHYNRERCQVSWHLYHSPSYALEAGLSLKLEQDGGQHPHVILLSLLSPHCAGVKAPVLPYLPFYEVLGPEFFRIA